MQKHEVIKLRRREPISILPSAHAELSLPPNKLIDPSAHGASRVSPPSPHVDSTWSSNTLAAAPLNHSTFFVTGTRLACEIRKKKASSLFCLKKKKWGRRGSPQIVGVLCGAYKVAPSKFAVFPMASSNSSHQAPPRDAAELVECA